MTTFVEPKKVVNEEYISWEQYDQLTLTLANSIHQSEWEFDQIVCIARGGMFVGDSLSRIFDKEFAVISARSYDKNSKEPAKLTISKEIAMTTDTLGKRILLIDDLVDSGGTMDKVIEFIKQKYSTVEEIRTAVLWKKSGSTYTPNYFAATAQKETWIHQPFEKFDKIKPQTLKQ